MFENCMNDIYYFIDNMLELFCCVEKEKYYCFDENMDISNYEIRSLMDN